MKKILVLGFIILNTAFFLKASYFNKEELLIPNMDTIIGYFNFNQLKKTPYNSWYEPEYGNYSLDSLTLNEFSDKLLKDITISIIIGTWCSDSQRELPRFVKILKYLDFNLKNTTSVGVNTYKKAKRTIVDNLKIDYVPTIIFYYDGEEIGRIVESPNESLEKDMLNILLRD